MVESFDCLLALRIVFLQKLTEVDEMDLYFEIPFAYILLYTFESFFLPTMRYAITFYILLFELRRPRAPSTFSCVSPAIWWQGRRSQTAHAPKSWESSLSIFSLSYNYNVGQHYISQ